MEKTAKLQMKKIKKQQGLNSGGGHLESTRHDAGWVGVTRAISEKYKWYFSANLIFSVN